MATIVTSGLISIC